MQIMSMDPVAGVNPSLMSGTTLSGTNSSTLKSADSTLRLYVEEMLQRDKRFIGMSRYLLNVRFWWSDAIPTACAGHGFIFFNPNWWDSMHHEERKTVIAHEIWHLILNHLERGEDLDPDSYNKAGDYIINLTAHDDGFVSTLNKAAKTNFGGKGMLINEKYRGMSTEQVYAIVHKDRKKDPNSHGGNMGTPSKDQIEDLIKQAIQGTGQDIQQIADQNQKEREAAVDSANKQAGNQPGGTQRLLQTDGVKVFIQNASYEEIFEEWLTDPLSGGKRTFMRPSRRQLENGVRLKGKFPKRGRKNRLTHLVYALDVSGSITVEEGKQFLRSASTLKKKLNPVLMTVILWDTRIVFEKTFREDEKLDNIRVQAGGGTDLRPVYKRVKELNPEALVIFTDLQVDIPPKPDWETIWFVSTTKVHPTYLNQVKYGNVYLIPEANNARS